MQVDVDLSGRIEVTTHRSVMALANGKTYSILLPASEKKAVLSALKSKKPGWSRKLTRVFVFSALLFLLLKEHISKLSLIIIDPEYPGHEPIKKDRVMTHCRKHGLEVYADQFTFRRVGKKSPAHELAIRVFRGNEQPDVALKSRDLLKLF